MGGVRKMPKILAIDDKQDNLIVLAAMLAHLMPECVLVTALSGPEGLRKAEAEQPDTILLDVKMPGMDGYEVCKTLKTDPRTSHIPVIMATAVHTDPQSRARGLETGADAFLTKPIEGVELVAQIRAMLRIKQAEDRLRQEMQLRDRVIDHKIIELKASDERYRELVEGTQDLIIQTDGQGNLLFANSAAQAILCARPEDCLGRSAFSFVHADDREETRRRFFDLASRRAVRGNFENRQVGCDGKEYCISWLSNFHYNGAGGLRFVNSIGRDVTELKRTVEQNIKLEEQLRQAQKMEAIGTLAGGIAHDFNNILAVIIGYAEIVREALPPDSPAANDLREVLHAGVRAKDLVQQILTFSRRSSEQLSPLKLQHLIKEDLKLLRATLPTTIDIRYDIDPHCGPVLADPTRIHQVIMNLCTNAYHAMREKGGVLDVGLVPVVVTPENAAAEREIRLRPGTYVRLAVSDTGTGMDAATLERIFEPYFTTKSKGEGTGLGLAVVHGIMQNCGGEISVSSRIGAGTTFHLYFPVFDREPPPAEEQTDLPLQTGRERILVVDDEEPLATLFKQMLERLGYQVRAFTDSEEALHAFSRNPRHFDLLFTDMTMPKMTGEQLARQVLDIRPDLPVILCTGYNEMMTAEKAEELGIARLVMKPVRQQELALIIRKVLDKEVKSQG
jgi:PAS domain S-box-containing protein